MKTWIDDEPPREPTRPAGPMPTYTSVNDLPLPLRAQLIALHRKGVPTSEIANFFSLPRQWVQLFVECPPGSPEH